MNYRSVNAAIISGKEAKKVPHNAEFYRYLLDNNVAYYYASQLCIKKGHNERQIIHVGNVFNSRATKTLRLIQSICEKHAIDVLLFKTYKYIPEAIDGDIDIFVKAKNFSAFILALSKKGFICHLENKHKAACIKPGFCKIEPRVEVVSHGELLFDQEQLWKNTKRIRIDSLHLRKPSAEIEAAYFLLNALYGPNYLRLYHVLVLDLLDKNMVQRAAMHDKHREDIEFLTGFLTKATVSRFPFFLPSYAFTTWWIQRMLFNRHVSLWLRVKNLLFFMYAKYGFLFFNRLPFRHDWGITI